jgi:hypothetical protein
MRLERKLENLVEAAEQAQDDQPRDSQLVSLILLFNVSQSTAPRTHRSLPHLPGLLSALLFRLSIHCVFICVIVADDASHRS